MAGGDLVCIEVRELFISLQLILDLTDPVAFLATEAVECITDGCTVGWLPQEDDPREEVPDEDELNPTKSIVTNFHWGNRDSSFTYYLMQPIQH